MNGMSAETMSMNVCGRAQTFVIGLRVVDTDLGLAFGSLARQLEVGQRGRREVGIFPRP